MKKLILIALLFISACDLPQTTQTTQVNPKSNTRKIDDFIDDFRKNNQKMNLNDITCKEANDKFSTQVTSFIKKDDDISDIGLTIVSIVERTKKTSLIHFHTDYSEKVQLDIFAFMPLNKAKNLNQSSEYIYHIIKYKKVNALDPNEIAVITTDRIYSYNIEICEQDLNKIPIGNYALVLDSIKHY
jgi:hypothetical protein